MAKKLTRAGAENREVRAAFKELCSLIEEGKLVPTFKDNGANLPRQNYIDGARLGNALILYDKLFAEEKKEGPQS